MKLNFWHKSMNFLTLALNLSQIKSLETQIEFFWHWIGLKCTEFLTWIILNRIELLTLKLKLIFLPLNYLKWTNFFDNELFVICIVNYGLESNKISDCNVNNRLCKIDFLCWWLKFSINKIHLAQFHKPNLAKFRLTELAPWLTTLSSTFTQE